MLQAMLFESRRFALVEVLRRRLGPEPTAPVHLVKDYDNGSFRLACGPWDEAPWHPVPKWCTGVAQTEADRLATNDDACVTCPDCLVAEQARAI